MFDLLFERSADAIWLLDPERVEFVDCNQAAVQLMRARESAQLVGVRPEQLSPPVQPDGRLSAARAAELSALTDRVGTHRFEWVARRCDGTDVPLEVMVTPTTSADGRRLNVVLARDISERKQAEAALRESEQKFRQLFEATTDAIQILDPQTRRFIECNEASVRLVGGGNREWLLSQPVEALAPEHQPDARPSREAARDWIERALREGSQRFEWLARRYGGELVPVEVLLTPMRLGERTLLVVVARDISARKQAEREILDLNQSLERRIQESTAELRASEARWRTLVDHAPEAIVVFSCCTGRFVSCNANATRFYGLPAERLMELSPADVSPEFQPDGRPSRVAAEEKIREALSGSTPVFEWLHRHADGHSLPCEVRLVRLPGEGEPLIRASILDNRERQRREKIQHATFEISEAVHTAADLPSLYENIHCIVAGLMPARNFYIALLEPRSQMIEFVYHVDERTNWPPPQQMDTGLTSVVLRTAMPLLVDPAMDTRKLRLGEKATFKGLDDAVYFESGVPAAVWLGVPLLRQGKAIGVVAVQDYGNPQAYCENDKQILTFVAGQIALAIERKRAEAELLRTLAREKELSQLKSNFVSMVSHEFRTPLGIIQSSAEILRDYFSQLESAQREEQLLSIINNTQRMAGMMEEILVLSRLDSGKMEFKPAPLDLAAFCHRLVDQVLSATGRRCPIGLNLTGVPSQAQADERLLDYIFSNLLGNAVKYSAAGSAIRFTVERDGPEAVCQICDQGIGIPAPDQPWMFNAFHRGGNVGDRPGTGLGLVLVKRCVELHRGQIRIESTVGKGTKVALRLPLFDLP